MIYKIFILISLFIAGNSPSWAGSGGMTGDGYPKGTYEMEPLVDIPHEAELFTLIKNLANEVPTMAVNMLKQYDQIKKANHLFHVKGISNTQFAGYDIGQEGERIFLWDDALALPTFDDTPTTPSFTKVMLHELLHIVVTKQDEERTQSLTEILYHLGRTRILLPGDRKILQTLLDKLNEDPSNYRYLPLHGKEDEVKFYQVLTLYREFNSIEACSDFRKSDLVRFSNNFSISFPLIPEGYREKLDQDSFFHLYRTYCFSKLENGNLISLYLNKDQKANDYMGWEGLYIVGTLSLFKHPVLDALLVQGFSGQKPKIILSRNQISTRGEDELVQDEYLRSLLPKLAPIAYRNTQRPILISEISERVPGFSTWFDLALSNYSLSEFRQDKMQEAPLFALPIKYFTDLGKRWLRYVSRLQPNGRITLTQKSDPNSLVDLITDSETAKCIIEQYMPNSPGDDYFTWMVYNMYLEDLDDLPVSLTCEFTDKTLFGLRTSKSKKTNTDYRSSQDVGFANHLLSKKEWDKLFPPSSAWWWRENFSRFREDNYYPVVQTEEDKKALYGGH